MDHDVPEVFDDNLSPLISQRHTALPPSVSDPQDEASDHHAHRKLTKKRKRYVSKTETITTVHDILTEATLTPTLLLVNILEAEQTRDVHSRLGEAFYRSTNAKNIHRLLDLIMANEKGSVTLKEWMKPHAIELVCDTIDAEMEAVKPDLHMNTTHTTPEFVEGWGINKIMDTVSTKTPTWTTVLTTAMESKACRARAEDGERYSQYRYAVSSNFILRFTS
jgi:hypothetical protein